MFDYRRITGLYFEASCIDVSLDEWNVLMDGAVQADKRQVNRLVKKFLPNLYEDLCLRCPNPYRYFRTDTHIVLVHSAIEYFLKFEYLG